MWHEFDFKEQADVLDMKKQGSFWVYGRPIREGVTVTPSLIDWAQPRMIPKFTVFRQM